MKQTARIPAILWGIELLAALFHPLFEMPARLQHHYRPFYQSAPAYV